MRQSKLWLGLIMFAAVLTACASPQAVPTATSVPPSPTVILPTETTAPTQTVAPTVENTPTEVAVVDECIACHTDKEQLIATGKPIEDEIVESEGAG